MPMSELKIYDEKYLGQGTQGRANRVRIEGLQGYFVDKVTYNMNNHENAIKNINTEKTNLSEREKKVIEIYLNYQKINQHKMKPIPVCYLAKD